MNYQNCSNNKPSFFSEIIEEVQNRQKLFCKRPVVVVPMANDEACSFAIHEGVKRGIHSAVLIGNKPKIEDMYGDLFAKDNPAFDSPNVEVFPEESQETACKIAVSMVRDGKADCLMKGHVSTSTLLKAVLNSDKGIKKARLLSHITCFESPFHEGLKILTDSAINIAPNVEETVDIINNAIEIFQVFEHRPPYVAILSASEKVSEKLPSTILGKVVSEKFKNCKNAFVEGPVSFDISMIKESSEIKEYKGRIQGNADILVVPRIEAGNMLYKSFQYFAGLAMAGVVVGARCPIILTSRSDNNETKFLSLVLGLVLNERFSTIS